MPRRFAAKPRQAQALLRGAALGVLSAGILLACNDKAAPARVDEAAPPAAAAAPPAGGQLSASELVPRKQAVLPMAEREGIGGRIIFLAQAGDRQTIEAVLPSGRSRDILLAAPVYPASVSPDGSMLAAISVEDQGDLHLERLQIFALGDAQPPEVLWTSDPAGHVRNPAWAPDGRWLVFESAEKSFRDIVRLDIGRDGEGFVRTRLTANEEGNFEPDISPDGTRIVFVSSRDGDAEIYVMDADGSGEQRLTHFHRNDSAPRWSPSGDTIAFASDRDGVERVYLMDDNGANLRRLTAPTQADAAAEPTVALGHEPHEQDFVWSPDGKAIAFVTRMGQGGSSLRLADPTQPGTVKLLTDGRFSDRSPVFSPQGRHLVFASNRSGPASTGHDENLDLYLIRTDGTALARLTDTPAAEWLPRWVR